MRKLRIWYEEEGDYLEIGWGERMGYMKDVGDDIWLREDNGGETLQSGNRQRLDQS